MKATKVIMPNGKERILIEVKPKEYDAINTLLWDAYVEAQGGDDEKEDKRYGAFGTATNSDAEPFYEFADHKYNQAA